VRGTPTNFWEKIMAVESAREEVQLSVGKDLNTVTIGGVKVEVSPDSNVVVYTNDGVQAKPAAASGEASAKGTQISISADFNTVVLNGATIERAAAGHLVISTPGTVITKPVLGSERGPGPANDSAAKTKTTHEIGDEMEDGTIYAGISPDTNEPMYARPKDEPGTYTFNQAANHAQKVGDGFRVPTINELNVLYENRNKGKLKGTFNETGSYPAGWYWSSSPYVNGNGWAQRFSDGYQDTSLRYGGSSLRLVR
jgi:hypothetical protein